MLIYMNGGLRQYDRHPVAPYIRGVWEFQFVIHGSCAPILVPETASEFAARRLWVFPPTVRHGWIAPEGPACEVLVFHFDQVPDPLRNVTEHKHLSVKLTPRDIRHLRHIQLRLLPHYHNPTQWSTLHVQKALLDLTLLALRDQPVAQISRDESYAHHITQQALSWFTERLSSNPSVAEVADGINVSPAYLRKLFHQATGHSPHEAFQNVQVERAAELLTHTDMPIKAIARTCGLPDPAAFSRLFQRMMKIAPREFRRRYVDGRGIWNPPTVMTGKYDDDAVA